MPTKRRDYRRNLRAKVQRGCVYCGSDDIRPGVPSTATYCSDACVQADHEGIDDLPPVIPLAWNDSTYAARKWAGER